MLATATDPMKNEFGKFADCKNIEAGRVNILLMLGLIVNGRESCHTFEL